MAEFNHLPREFSVFRTIAVFLFISWFAFLRPAPAGDVVINEFMAINDSTIQDENGDASDWIEIFNGASTNINLAGWHLTDNAGNLSKWTFPSVTINAGQTLLIFASEKTNTLHANFKLSGSGEYLALVDPDGTTVAFEFAPQYPEQVADVSYGLRLGTTNQALAVEAGPVRALIPTNGALGTTWSTLR